jgi:phospholipid/cholesterol/gamma-HCH transport system substrate-binding protein
MNAMLESAERDTRFDRLNFRTGLFIALAFLLLAAVTAATLLRQGLFAQNASLYFFSDSAQGISRGMSVQLSGFKIGNVEEIALEPDTRVKARLVVKSEYLRHITQDAQARLAKEGLIGASFIEILPGSREARPIPNNGVVKFERAGDFALLAEALADKLHPILDDVKKITASVNDPDGDIRATLANVRQASAAVAGLQKDLNRLARTVNERTEALTGQAGRVLERVDVALDKAGGAIATLGGTLAALDRQLPDTLLRLDRTLANLESVTADARRVSSGLANDVPPALSQGRALMEDTREIVDGARRSWPIRGFLVEPLERSLPLDSNDGRP